MLRHHERWDGSGYPDGLKEYEIPLAARIVAVADAYGAMVDRRVYKEPRSDQEARAELRRCAGTQFDPDVVEVFLSARSAPQPEADVVTSTPGPGWGLVTPFRAAHPDGEAAPTRLPRALGQVRGPGSLGRPASA